MKLLILSIVLILLALLPAGCSADDPLTDGIYFEEVNSEQIYLGGEQLLIPAYGEIYATASHVETLTLADTYYLVDPPTTEGEMKGFSSNNQGRIIYTDITNNRICLLNITLTVSTGVPDVPLTLSARIYRSGVADTPSTVLDALTVGDKIEALPMVSLITLLNTNDYVEIYFASSKADVDITVETMQIIATTVD